MFESFFGSILLLRCHWPFSVTSWIRTEKRNLAVGGVPGSTHLIGLGVDVVLDDMKKNIDFEKDCDRLSIQPILEKDHYHLQPK